MSFMISLYFSNAIINCFADEKKNRASNYGGVPCTCIKLTQLHQELTDASQPHILNFENLQKVILEATIVLNPQKEDTCK